MFEQIAGAVLGNVAGRVLDDAFGDGGARDFQSAQIDLQKEFAKNGIRWRVEDAKAAGIHPALALGAKTAEYQPQMVSKPESSIGWLTEAGHDIGRSLQKSRTADERTVTAVESLALERGALQNDLLRLQIASARAKLSADQVGPPMVDPANPGVRLHGTSDGQTINETAMARSTSFPGRPHQEAGAINELGFSRTPTGFAPVMSQDFKQRAEDDALSEVPWHVRNRLPQMIGVGAPPPDSWLPKGYEVWNWSTLRQEWQPGYRRRSPVKYKSRTSQPGFPPAFTQFP